MKNILLFLCAALLAAMASAGEVLLEWDDNADNESGFELEGLTRSGEWEALSRTAASVTQILVESQDHVAWRVRAFNIEWGIYSEYSNVLMRPVLEAPTNLRATTRQGSAAVTSRPKRGGGRR